MSLAHHMEPLGLDPGAFAHIRQLVAGQSAKPIAILYIAISVSAPCRIPMTAASTRGGRRSLCHDMGNQSDHKLDTRRDCR